MKKTLISLFLLLSMIFTSFSLTSCSDKKQPPEIDNSYTDNYIYTKQGGVLYKINPTTAYATPVCPDPLCMHNDKSCYFYGMSEGDVKILGQYIYYMRDSKLWEYHKTLCRFNLESGAYEVLYQAEEGSITDMFASERYVYFNYVTLNEGKYEYYIYRYDIAAKKSERLSDKFDDAQNAYAIDGERVYWEGALSGDTKYSTTLGYKDRRDNDEKKNHTSNENTGKYYYRLERSGFHQESYSDLQRLIRVDLATGEEVTVFEDLSCAPIIHDGKIIYSKLDEPRYMGEVLDEETGKYKSYYDKWGGKYYICDSDGSNERLLCDFSDTKYISQFHPNTIGLKRGVGDWIVTWMQTYVPESDDGSGKVKRGDNVYLLINIVTGEFKEVQFETRS